VKRTLLITGATGLIGGHLLAALLDDSDTDLHVLVRARADDDATERMRRVLAFVGREKDLGRLTIHCGDLTQPDIGLPSRSASRLRATVTDIFHAAADIAFDDGRQTGRSARTNVLGTSRILGLCSPSTRLFHLSSAYVAGLHPELFMESDLDVRQDFRNDYERSKYEAEQVVRAAFVDRPGQLTVIRPSIVLGDRVTGRTFQYSSLYAVLKLLRYTAERRPGSRITFDYDPDATQNYVPVDLLVRWLAHIVRESDCWGHTYHLASEHPVTNREMGIMLGDLLGVGFNPQPAPPLHPDPVSRGFVQRAAPYLPYLASHPRFACDGRRRLPEGDADFRPDARFLRAMLDYCLQTKWGRTLDLAR
jgi:thioester reductase-like protein